MPGFDSNRAMPTDSTIPRHMLCRECGRCSTAIDRNNVCWRHKGYIENSYLGKVEVLEKKDLPTQQKGIVGVDDE